MAKTERYINLGWTWIQDYDNSGPALHYDQPVTVVYTSDNSWTQNIRDWNKDGEDDIRQVLQQNGTAEIYKKGTTELLDTRKFIAHEIDEDESMDAGAWNGAWWDIFKLGDWTKAELIDYEWKIPGVYIFRLKIVDGQILEGKRGFYTWTRPPSPNE